MMRSLSSRGLQPRRWVAQDPPYLGPPSPRVLSEMQGSGVGAEKGMAGRQTRLPRIWFSDRSVSAWTAAKLESAELVEGADRDHVVRHLSSTHS
jgi:hypothetical protein